MQIIADLHLHSKYSRAVSQKMNLEEISLWASKKGINLVATGDWTHPLWFREIKNNLQETSPGVYSLKNRPAEQKNDVYFILSTEISSIYSQGEKSRRVHNLILSPSIEVSEKIIKELQKGGANLLADGRPIIGLSSKQLLETVLNIDKAVLLIPCHAWTPWFSLYGSKSGFDSIEECFEELSDNIYAVETGLSSDPIMNWQIKELENRSIVSFSDAHSGPKLGREATVFTCNMKHVTCNISYNDIADAIKQSSNSHLKIAYTIEFFPEEGKYHWTGHRDCGIRYSPSQVKEKGTICPICHQPLTIGVENRVIALAEKILTNEDLLLVENSTGPTFVYDKKKRRLPFVSLVPLQEILIEVHNNSVVAATQEYERLTKNLGTEFDVLLKKPYEEIARLGGERLKQAIQIVRERKVYVDPGYDGIFGKVKIFNNSHGTDSTKTNQGKKEQLNLF